LTAGLRAAGVLPCGAVTAVDCRPNAAFNSFTTHLTVIYSADAPSSAPRRLLLKRSRPEAWAIKAGAREAAFYRLAMTRRVELPMIVSCYAAAYDERVGSSYVLLADLSESHRASLTRDQQLAAGENVPPEEVSERVVETLARFHAAWWEHPLLGSGAATVGQVHPDRQSHEGWATYMRRRADAWADLVAIEGAWFPDDLRRLYEAVLARTSILWERYLGPRLTTLANVTLIHGDAYFANFLYPIDGAGQTYLIDWQSPEANLGAGDLANLMATFWTPA
jgi:hypothetical protein